MVIKRKRSESEMSITSGILSSPLSPGSMMSIDNISPQRPQSRFLLSSRTRKRYRDNRPSESECHEKTIAMLMSAQTAPQAPLQSRPPQPTTSVPVPAHSGARQLNLHSYWLLPSTRDVSPESNCSSPAQPHTMPSYVPASNCEDCDMALESGADGDIDMMDIDVVSNGGNHSCVSCGREVCRNCAVSNLGADRRCLGCAGKEKRWIGGLGWLNRD